MKRRERKRMLSRVENYDDTCMMGLNAPYDASVRTSGGEETWGETSNHNEDATLPMYDGYSRAIGISEAMLLNCVLTPHGSRLQRDGGSCVPGVDMKFTFLFDGNDVFYLIVV